jgi:hypothetical protein
MAQQLIPDGVAVLKHAMQLDAEFKSGKHELATEVIRLYCAGRDLFQRAVDMDATAERAKIALVPKIAEINNRLQDLEDFIKQAMADSGARRDNASFADGLGGRDAISSIAQAAPGLAAKRKALTSPVESPVESAAPVVIQALGAESAGRNAAAQSVPSGGSATDQQEPLTEAQLRNLTAKDYLAHAVYPILQPALQALDLHRPSLGRAREFLCDCLLSPEYLQVSAGGVDRSRRQYIFAHILNR